MKEENLLVYIADDGSIFRSKLECIAYEQACVSKEQRLNDFFAHVIVSRTSNLFEDFPETYPAELLKSFDHCGFSDAFKKLIDGLGITSFDVANNLAAYARLGMLWKIMCAAIKEYPHSHSLPDDIQLLRKVSMSDYVDNIGSFADFGGIVMSVFSEKEQLEKLLEEYELHRQAELRELCEEQWDACQASDEYYEEAVQAEWAEELERRDPFEGSPY